jgi:hypothetical protein
MPTVLRRSGFSVMVLTNDHTPAHVHVFRAGTEVIVNLSTGMNGPQIREVKRMSKGNVRKAVRLIEENLATLREEWRRIHG